SIPPHAARRPRASGGEEETMMRSMLVAGALGALVVSMLMPGAARAAGNVTAQVSGGNLVIIGDGASNQIAIDQAGLAPGEIRITPTGTTLNGVATAAVFPGFAGDIQATLDAGDDAMT